MDWSWAFELQGSLSALHQCYQGEYSVHRITTKIRDADTTKTYCKIATSDESILGIRKEIQSRLLSLLVISDSQEKHLHQKLTKGFCSGFVHLKLGCIMAALGEESEISSGCGTEATANVEVEAALWRSWVV